MGAKVSRIASILPTKTAQTPRFLGALLLAAMLLASAAASAAVPSVRAQIGAALEKEGMVGAVWSTVAADGSIMTSAAGLRDARSRTPMRSSDKVQVGSIAKAVVATGILHLVSQGRLRLDAPVGNLLPDVAIENHWAAESPLLLRHLLDHTSGLDDARLWQVFSLEASPDVPLGDAVDTRLRLRMRPGTTFSYSNTGYVLLGMIIERLAGERYETYLDRTLLDPLGMRDSSFAFVTQANDPRMAMGHFERAAPHPAVPLYARPASQFTTTAHDMAMFARFLMGDGSIGGRPFVDPRLMRARGRPSGTDAALAGLDVGYSLGLGRNERGGAVGLCHGGETVGFRAMLCLYPEKGKAFFRAVNADVEGGDYRSLDTLLVRGLGITPQVPSTAAPLPADIADWEGIYVPSPARFETFAYLDFVLNFVTVARDGEGLRLKPFQSSAKRLVPVGGRLFRADDRSAASYVLVANPDGVRTITDEYRSLRKVEWWLIMPLWLSLAAGMLGIVYILAVGLVRAARRSLRRNDPLLAPLIAVAALAIPIPLFLNQSFLAMGDLTPASGALALVTALLPLAMILGLVRQIRRGMKSRSTWLDALAMAAVVQWTGVLAAWGLLPLRLWA